MSRTRFALALAGASLAAGAVGGALGVLFAPVSGAEMRRQLAWRARHDAHWLRRGWELLVDRACGAHHVSPDITRG